MEDREGEREASKTASTREGVLDRSLALVRFLRDHCSWDREQTPRSLVPHLLEESHEVVDAILEERPAELEGELGDLLLNLAFQIVIGEESGHFTRESVVARLEEKMERRHPDLFGLGEREGWETLKARERKDGEGVLRGLANGLDPLLRAHRMQEKVSGVGFDWEEPVEALAKVSEEIEEVREALESGSPGALEEELGDLVFSMVNLIRLTGNHASLSLEKANRKFQRRFEKLEGLARSRGIQLEDSSLEEMDVLWDEVKVEEKREAAGQ